MRRGQDITAEKAQRYNVWPAAVLDTDRPPPLGVPREGDVAGWQAGQPLIQWYVRLRRRLQLHIAALTQAKCFGDQPHVPPESPPRRTIQLQIHRARLPFDATKFERRLFDA